MLGGEVANPSMTRRPLTRLFALALLQKCEEGGVLNTHTHTHVVLQKIALSYCCNRRIANSPNAALSGFQIHQIEAQNLKT